MPKPSFRTASSLFVSDMLVTPSVVDQIDSQCGLKLRRRTKFPGPDGIKCVELEIDGKLEYSYYSYIRVKGEIYALGECIGKGSYSKVLLGLNLGTFELVAVKVQKGTNINVIREQTEANANFGIGTVGEVKGPMFRFITEKEFKSYVIMPLATTNLSNVLKSKTWDLNMITVLILIAEQLMEMHKAGKIHGGIKSDNILIIEHEPYLCDFSMCYSVGSVREQYCENPEKFPQCARKCLEHLHLQHWCLLTYGDLDI